MRILLFAAPLLGLWYLVFARRLGPKPLPEHYAICSRREAQQVVTMDESHGGAHLRTQCIVVKAGTVVGTGSLNEVRGEWGDVEMTGTGVGRGGGVRIYFLNKGETLLPGLCVPLSTLIETGPELTRVPCLAGSTRTLTFFSKASRRVRSTSWALLQSRVRPLPLRARLHLTLMLLSPGADVVDRIARFVEADPVLQADKSRFILGLGWDQTRFSDTGGAFPTAVRPSHGPCPAGFSS